MNTVMEREVTEGEKREGQKDSHGGGGGNCIKINLQKIEAIMNSLIPLEFHRANNDEPEALKLL